MEEMIIELTSAPVPGHGWGIVLLRLSLAILLGALIGWERESRNKHAGLRTHVMIALAACLFALITLAMMLSPISDDDSIRKDPIRLIEAVTAGVAFLAAGTIFTRRGDVKGLTTGAGMWLAGAVGVACGLGQIGLAVVATVLALVVLRLFKVVEPRADRT
ncbi:MgtC/SapB family protein [Pseudooceanicola sp. LIPI14-2-Ac024]|uniref:MgtC/SapB family protein n=1 Tax=Pseudooceanicola sp. LIPI14-2-Ac024 TaxID=3344875 RepID=UPI0035CF6762